MVAASNAGSRNGSSRGIESAMDMQVVSSTSVVRIAPCHPAQESVAAPAIYMLRRYSPPTSYSAWLIWPSECVFTASMSAANTLRRSRAVSCR